MAAALKLKEADFDLASSEPEPPELEGVGGRGIGVGVMASILEAQGARRGHPIVRTYPPDMGLSGSDSLAASVGTFTVLTIASVRGRGSETVPSRCCSMSPPSECSGCRTNERSRRGHGMGCEPKDRDAPTGCGGLEHEGGQGEALRRTPFRRFLGIVGKLAAPHAGRARR